MSRKGATVLAARLARAYPALSPFSAASLAEELVRIERAQHRHAVRCCSGEDGGYVRKRKAVALAGIGDSLRRDDVEHDPDAERKAGERIERRCARWVDRVFAVMADGPVYRAAIGAPAVTLQHDPRGPVLLLRLPGDDEAKAVMP